MHPEVRRIGSLIRFFLPYFKERTFSMCNRLLKLMKGRKFKSMDCQETYIESNSDWKIRLCIYRPLKQEKEAPGILWIHGGGYWLGIPEQDYHFIKIFVEEGCTVVAPDYTLSVNEPYPAALEDCYSALSYLKENAPSLMVDIKRLFVGGNSAGGGLAAVLCIYARDKKEIQIAFQMPLYPMLDDRMQTESMKGNDAPVWNEKSNIAGWKLYIRDDYQKEGVSPYAAPGRLEDFSNLPPAFTFVGGIDPFRDETVAYFDKLSKASIPAECHVYEGCYHAFDLMARKSQPAREAMAKLKEAFLRAYNK